MCRAMSAQACARSCACRSARSWTTSSERNASRPRARNERSVRSDRSIARNLRRTTTGSTAKTLLAQSLCEAGIEDAAQVSLVQIAPQDVLGYLCASLWQCLAQETAPL